MKRIIAAVTVFILCIFAASAMAVTPVQFRDRFMDYRTSSGGSSWEWNYDSSKRLHTGKCRNGGAVIGIREAENGEINLIIFTCMKDQMAMKDDASFPEALSCYSDLIVTCTDLFTALADSEFMWDYGAYDIYWLTGDNDSFYLKSYPDGFVVYSEFSAENGYDVFLLSISQTR